jgi:hypothetical protein
MSTDWLVPKITSEAAFNIERFKRGLQQEGPGSPELVLSLCQDLMTQNIHLQAIVKQATMRIAELELGIVK